MAKKESQQYKSNEDLQDGQNQRPRIEVAIDINVHDFDEYGLPAPMKPSIAGKLRFTRSFELPEGASLITNETPRSPRKGKKKGRGKSMKALMEKPDEDLKKCEQLLNEKLAENFISNVILPETDVEQSLPIEYPNTTSTICSNLLDASTSKVTQDELNVSLVDPSYPVVEEGSKGFKDNEDKTSGLLKAIEIVQDESNEESERQSCVVLPHKPSCECAENSDTTTGTCNHDSDPYAKGSKTVTVQRTTTLPSVRNTGSAAKRISRAQVEPIKRSATFAYKNEQSLNCRAANTNQESVIKRLWSNASSLPKDKKTVKYSRQTYNDDKANIPPTDQKAKPKDHATDGNITSDDNGERQVTEHEIANTANSSNDAQKEEDIQENQAATNEIA